MTFYEPRACGAWAVAMALGRALMPLEVEREARERACAM